MGLFYAAINTALQTLILSPLRESISAPFLGLL